MGRRTAIAAVSLLLPLAAAAEIGPVGTDFQVNSYTVSYQLGPAIAVAGNGRFVVAWSSYEQDGDNYGVFAKRYNSAGQAVGAEFRVNSFTTATQRDPAVGAAGSGNFAVVWWSSAQDGSSAGVFGQRYDSAGGALGSEFQVNTYTANFQLAQAMAMRADGSFVVAWESYAQDGSNRGVFGQRYDGAGQVVGTEFQVNSHTIGMQRSPSVAAAADGSFAVSWESDAQDGNGFGVFAQRYDGAGQAVGAEFQVNRYTPSDQVEPSIATQPGGGLVLAWSSRFQDGNADGVFGQLYDSGGLVVGSEFQINTFTANYQETPRAAAAADGGFLVAWQSNTQEGGGSGIFARRYDSAGQAAGTEFQVNVFTLNYQVVPVVGPTNDDGFVVAWQSDAQDGDSYGIFARRIVDPVAHCTFAPSATCGTSVKAQLQLKLNPNPERNKIKWKFAGGPALGQADFGDPTTTATYALCIYDDGALKAALQVGPSGTLWSAIGGKGYQYADGLGGSDGVTKMKLLGGSVPKLQLKGKGDDLPMPTPFTGIRFFAQTTAVTAQLREANGDCYTASFTDADTKKNDGKQYKAKN